MSQNQEEVVEIDLLTLLKLLLNKWWLIALSAIICGILVFLYTYMFVTPMFQASVKIYVNNSSFSVGSTSFSISSSELSAAKTLVETYIVILNTRETLEDVIEEAGVQYEYNEIVNLIEANSIRSTEVFEIKVTCSDPDEAKLIANTIAYVLPDKIANIVDGSSVRIVEYAVKPNNKISPSYTKNTTIGLFFGVMISSGIIVLLQIFDVYIRSEEYLLQKYNIPLLASIPDMNATKKNHVSYYKSYGYGGNK